MSREVSKTMVTGEDAGLTRDDSSEVHLEQSRVTGPSIFSASRNSIYIFAMLLTLSTLRALRAHLKSERVEAAAAGLQMHKVPCGVTSLLVRPGCAQFVSSHVSRAGLACVKAMTNETGETDIILERSDRNQIFRKRSRSCAMAGRSSGRALVQAS